MQQLGPGVPGPGERQLRRFPGTDPGVRVLCSCPRFISKAQGTFPLSGLPLIPRAHGGPRLGPGRGPQKRGPGVRGPQHRPLLARGQGRAHLCGSGFLVLENVLWPLPLCAATAPHPRRPGDVPTQRASTLRSSRDDTRPEPAPPERRTTPFPQTSPVRSAGDPRLGVHRREKKIYVLPPETCSRMFRAAQLAVTCKQRGLRGPAAGGCV